MRVLALLDGTLLDPDQPTIRADDLGLTRGDGVFETVLVVDGRARELDRHLDRMARSCVALDLPFDRSAWLRVVDVVVGAWSLPGELAVKLVLTRGPQYGAGVTAFALGTSVAPAALHQRSVGVSVVTLARGFDPAIVASAPWLLLGAKTLSYAVNQAALRHAAAVGADDVIFVAADGSVLEGPTSTVVLARGRSLWTPPPGHGILLGTTQQAVFVAAERGGWVTKVEPITVADLMSADGVFLVSSIRKITRVRVLDGVSLPDGSGVGAELASVYEGLYA